MVKSLYRYNPSGLLPPPPSSQVECGDAHGNTLLSEASAGGVASTVGLLLER